MTSDIDIAVIILVALVLGVPILGLTVGLTIKPIVESILLIQDSLTKPTSEERIELRLSRLEEAIRGSSRTGEFGEEKTPGGVG